MSTLDDIKRFDDEPQAKKPQQAVAAPKDNSTSVTTTAAAPKDNSTTAEIDQRQAAQTEAVANAIANGDGKGMTKALQMPVQPSQERVSAAPGVRQATEYLKTHPVDMNAKVPAPETHKPEKEQTANPTSYDELLPLLNSEIERYRKESEDDEKEMKRVARNKRLAAISDGISALANMWATYKGAVNAYNPKNSLYGKARDRYDKLKGERDGNRNAYLNAALNKYKILKGKEDAEVAKANAADKMELSWYKLLYDKDYKDKMLGAKNEANKQAADKAKADQDYKDKTLKLQGDRLAEQNRHNRTMEGISSSREARLASGDTSTTSGGGKGKGGKYTIKLRDGSIHTYTKEQIGAINGLSGDMIRRSRAAAEAYRKEGNYNAADHYEAIADALEGDNSTDRTNSIIVKYINEFPGMQDGIRKILGIGGKKAQRKASNKTTSTTPTTNKKSSNVGYGGITFN